MTLGPNAVETPFVDLIKRILFQSAAKRLSVGLAHWTLVESRTFKKSCLDVER